ncbi:dienelactone hydrolase family protein [Trinickia caryophylli]|uniref:dienelactone hydrolase family protein n=1 Tax=Trinickia caryophylli TaxID=28094 RepID=UPI000A151534|nr:dienelactone hydrolase family protein [Trinickia caryophylli]WQE13661.1 dienelactone hydrolase family protein [Trinickia caryophylli]
MTSQWIDIETGDGRMQGYLALPRAGKGPGVVIVQEIFGVNGHIRSIAEQYALAGYVAIAPDIFWRSEPRVELGYDGADRDKAMALFKAADVEKTLGDLGATVRALKSRPETVGKTAAVGYCFGGRLAYLMAARGGIDAAVAYYGGGIQNQLDEADKLSVPVLFHFGDQDGSIPMDAVEQIKARVAGKPGTELYVYEGAGHGFNCTDRASYDQRASALALGRTMTFLASRV